VRGSRYTAPKGAAFSANMARQISLEADLYEE